MFSSPDIRTELQSIKDYAESFRRFHDNGLMTNSTLLNIITKIETLISKISTCPHCQQPLFDAKNVSISPTISDILPVIQPKIDGNASKRPFITSFLECNSPDNNYQEESKDDCLLKDSRDNTKAALHVLKNAQQTHKKPIKSEIKLLVDAVEQRNELPDYCPFTILLPYVKNEKQFDPKKDIDIFNFVKKYKN